MAAVQPALPAASVSLCLSCSALYSPCSFCLVRWQPARAWGLTHERVEVFLSIQSRAYPLPLGPSFPVLWPSFVTPLEPFSPIPWRAVRPPLGLASPISLSSAPLPEPASPFPWLAVPPPLGLFFAALWPFSVPLLEPV